MDRHLQEIITIGDTQSFLHLAAENEAIAEQTTAGSGNTILHLAARFGHIELAREIVRLWPELVVAENERMETPLHVACSEGMTEVVRLMVETEPLVVYKVNGGGETVLFVACGNGKLEVAKLLLGFPWLLMLEVDGFTTTSLHVAASGGHTEIVKEILKVRPDFAWKRDINGCTPLHISCSKGHLDITRELLKLDADFCTLQDCHGRTPLHLAAIKGRVNIIDEILSWSLEFAELITKNGDTILHLAVKNNQYDTIKYLIERLNITKLANFPDSDGNTILHLATAGKLTAMITFLLKFGVDVNATNRRGYTALDVVELDESNSGALAIVPALLEAGAKRCNQLPSFLIDTQQIHKTRGNKISECSSQRRHHRRGHSRRREKQFEFQNEGLRNARNTITIVAVLIATVAFAAGINPPGGFDEETGKSIMGKQTSFKVFMVCNIVALFLSLGIVIFLLSIIPFQRKSMMKLLTVTHKVMWVSTSFMASAYIAAIWTILPNGRGTVWVLASLVSIGGGCTLAIFVGLGILLIKHWLRKSELRNRKQKRNDRSPSSSISRLEDMRMMKKVSWDSTSNSDIDSSDHGYHLY